MNEVNEEMLDLRLPRFRSLSVDVAVSLMAGSSKFKDSLDLFFHRERVCDSDSFDTCRVSS
jgi:hypothetical protein